jgi:hypothetical protein
MKLQIHHIRTIVLLCTLAIATVSCKKSQEATLLAPGAASIKEALNTDTLSASKTMIATKDSIVTVKLEAVLKAAAPSGTHTVVLGVDTSQMAAYRAKYGNMPVLPAANYLIPFASCNIAAGATASSSAEINIGSESTLQPFTTYVLPVVIKTVDDQAPERTSQGQVIYLLIKTTSIYGSPISKASWSITSYSSELSAANGPAKVLDNTSSYWLTSLTGSMPQYVTIDMGQSYNIKTVTYQDWVYYAYGANPTQIMIELSTDGNTWANMGTFTDTAPSFLVKNLPMNPVTPARYIRFTVLQATKYVNTYTAVAIAEIGANN